MARTIAANRAARAADPTKDREARFDHDLVGRIVGERYELLGVLGEGGMGTVYEAAHLGLDRLVAVKVLSAEQAKKQVAVKRFQQEARTAGAIGHPNICEIYDMGSLDDGRPYLVMEKLVGRTFAEVIADRRKLSFSDLVTVMLQVLSGLAAAHGKNVLHRDIKPENVFLAERAGSKPIAKILDFGVSKMMGNFGPSDAKREELDLTKTGMVMGTPYYMSPEQARGRRDLDGRVDVYACGVMMYEAICGVRPFRASNYASLLLAIVTTEPTPIPQLRPETPTELVDVVTRAMTRSRDQRYPSALEMMRALYTISQNRTRALRTKERGRPRVAPVTQTTPVMPVTSIEDDTSGETRTTVWRPRAKDLHFDAKDALDQTDARTIPRKPRR